MNNSDSSQIDSNPKKEFVAELTPHRSLGRAGFLLLMAFVTLTCLISGLMFLLMGAWPVFLFMALDILIVWAAFKLNYRAARVRERVSVRRDQIKVQKFDTSGRVAEHIFNPFWTRFEVKRHDEIGITSMMLESKNNSVSIGGFLNPSDRESFAHAFGHALASAKA